jgi:hypothetical protein
MKAFSYWCGGQDPPLEKFEALGFTPFLAERIRVLGAYEHIYNIEPAIPISERKITPPPNIFEEYDNLQKKHLRALLLQAGGKDVDYRKTYWTLPLLRKSWKYRWDNKRWYNWNMPVASLDSDIHYAYCTMIAHGMVFEGCVRSWHKEPINVEDPLVKYIERAKNLCVRAIEKYWELVQALPTTERGKYGEACKAKEFDLQKTYLTQNMELCDLVSWDLDRAKRLWDDEYTGSDEDNDNSQGSDNPVNDGERPSDGIGDVEMAG